MPDAGDELLRGLLAATSAYDDDPRYQRWDGYFISFGNARGLKPRLIGEHADLNVRADLIDELTDSGDLRQLEAPVGSAGGRKFALTAQGKEAARDADGSAPPAPTTTATVVTGAEFDVFLSHASEDKDQVVVPLAEELARRDIHVWLDRQQLTLGDSLSQKIDQGLSSARFGVVVLSEAFFAKNWPRRELDGLVARETAFGAKVILPVRHRVTHEQILEFSAPLADKLAADTSSGIPAVASQIQEALGGPIRSGQVIRRSDATSELTSSRPGGSAIDPGAGIRDAVLEQRTGDIRTDALRALNDARAAITLTDATRFEQALRGLTTTAAVTASSIPQDEVTGFVIDGYHRLFETTVDSLGRGGLHAEAIMSLWPHLLTHVRALGALLVRYEVWALAGRLAQHQPPPNTGDIYPGWICFMEVQLARRRVESNAELVRQPVRRAAELIAAVPVLAPDSPSENGRLESVLQFDLLSRLVETNLALCDGRSTETFPPFARFDVAAIRPLVRRLVEDQTLIAQLLPDLARSSVLEVLSIVDFHAGRASGEHSFWDGIADVDIQRRLPPVDR